MSPLCMLYCFTTYSEMHDWLNKQDIQKGFFSTSQCITRVKISPSPCTPEPVLIIVIPLRMRLSSLSCQSRVYMHLLHFLLVTISTFVSFCEGFNVCITGQIQSNNCRLPIYSHLSSLLFSDYFFPLLSGQSAFIFEFSECL